MESKGMELSALDTTEKANEGFDVRIVNPKTDEETDIVITILGQDSEKYREASRKQNARQLKATLAGGSKREEKLLEIGEEHIPSLLAETTVGWTGMLKDGQPLPFSLATAKMVYENYPVIRDQVLEAQRNRANFLGN